MESWSVVSPGPGSRDLLPPFPWRSRLAPSGRFEPQPESESTSCPSCSSGPNPPSRSIRSCITCKRHRRPNEGRPAALNPLRSHAASLPMVRCPERPIAAQQPQTSPETGGFGLPLGSVSATGPTTAHSVGGTLASGSVARSLSSSSPHTASLRACAFRASKSPAFGSHREAAQSA